LLAVAASLTAIVTAIGVYVASFDTPAPAPILTPAVRTSRLFPDNAIWNLPCDQSPVHSESAKWMAANTAQLRTEFGDTYAGEYYA